MTTDHGFDASWDALLAVLTRVAPDTAAALNPPGGGVARIGSELGLGVTPDVAAWFGRHNGTDPTATLLPLSWVLPVHEAVDQTRLDRTVWSKAGREPGGTAGEVAGTWCHRYLRIATDAMGGGLFVDLRDGPLSGCVRTWDTEDADDVEEPVVASLTALVETVTRALTDGTPALGFVARTCDGELDWVLP